MSLVKTINLNSMFNYDSQSLKLFTKEIVDKIKELVGDKEYVIMEFCGTHTHEISRYALRSILPKNLELRSGPGCPVCVTAEEDIDYIINLVLENDLGVITFGDIVNVPGSVASLSYLRAMGKDVKVVYNPMESIKIAENNLNKNYVLVGIGFETTVPMLAHTLINIKQKGLKNLFYLSLHKLTPPATIALLNSNEVKLDGIIGPGHVSTIIGAKAWEDIAYKYKIPFVIMGFEPQDMLFGIYVLLEKIINKEYGVWNTYLRSVRYEGNKTALDLIFKVFRISSANWRGLGIIPDSGLELNDEFKEYDVKLRFPLTKEIKVRKTACRCGDVLRGAIKPYECPLFAKACKPSSPKGPCMVSSEGSCAAYYLYEMN